MLYTSGSTGRPKGVINTHRGLVNRLCWMQDTYSLTPGDRVLQKTPLSFDVSAWEFFWPLLTGATLVLARPDGHKDSAYLAELIQQAQITTLHFVPSMLAAFLEAPEAAQCNSLKRVICSGEALPTDLQTRFFQTLPNVELHNLYGPTEAAIDVTAWACQPEDDASPTVPIGRPIANTQIHLLDSLGRLVPPGIPGELHIGGVGVARGYLNRPDLTAEKFVPNPFGQGAGDGRQETGDRRQEAEEPYSLFPIPCSPLYKTGDRARYRPDGAIEFLGRIDHQVKLRGFRIELGEIEAVLTQHPEVAQAAVVLREDNGKEPQLVAYVVQAADAARDAGEFQTNGVGSIPSSPTPQLPNSPAPSTLRTYLSDRLPTYMVPTQFVALATLPLTPNGKVDRKALPAPERPEPNRAVAAPRTVTAELLANIWAAVLGQDVIGQDDNFFELGGHSLLATRVVAQVRQAFGVELPLRSLFEQPTLTQLAPVVDGLKSGRGDAALEPIQQVARSGNLPLADAQQRQWILAQLEPDSPFYVIPTAVQVQGNLSVDLLQQSLQQLVERHEVLRTAFQDVSGNAQIVLRPSVEIEVPVVDLTELQEAAQQQRMQTQIQAEAQTPFDLSQAPLLRLKVLRLAAQDHVVLLSLHHIIADGWSMGIVVRELAQVYEALRSHQSPELPPLPIQYVDYAAWQQQQSAEQTEHLDYWQQQLHGAPPLLELPTDYPRPAVQSFAGATCEFQLTAAQTQSLEKLSQQQGVTLFMTLLAAFQVVLHRYSGFTDIVIGTPVANRPRTELEGLIGMFVNTLVLRTDLADNPRFEELLGRVREVALEAYAHQSTPFEQVVEALEVSRSWSHAPLFQVMFVLQNAPLQPLILDELAWQPLSMESGTAKFDLTLSMRPTDGGLQGALEYRTDLFEADTVQRLVGHLFTLLTTICEQPRSRLAELPLLTEIEQTQLWQWNQTQTEYPRHRCIHELFEQQVEKTPQAIALSFGDQSFTYQALNENANQLAGYLRSPAITATITADTLIGLWADRCPATIVAMLAILKAGGAYVPLDPNYPAERLQFMIEDAGLDLVIAPQAIDLPLAADTCQLLALNAEAVAMAQQRTTNLPTSATIENLAYVLYTSGSTGQPKGVCTPHRGVVRLVKNTNYVQFGADEVCLQAASLSFDASTFEIWGALLNGGKLVLLPTSSPSLADLAQAIAQHQVTTLWLTAGLFHLMVDEQLEALKSVRQLLAGGDVLSGAHVHKALSALKHTRLINGYGPTENTTFTCCHTITAASLNTTALKSSPPIGSPIANTQV
ncbi:MAG: amino acid adenylation domain-containing protein, partial [Cyanobacteria bacterium P01_C01_bin.147]